MAHQGIGGFGAHRHLRIVVEGVHQRFPAGGGGFVAQPGAAQLAQEHVALLQTEQQQGFGLLRRGLHQAGQRRPGPARVIGGDGLSQGIEVHALTLRDPLWVSTRRSDPAKR